MLNFSKIVIIYNKKSNILKEFLSLKRFKKINKILFIYLEIINNLNFD
jgi:hypothetical protein